MRFFASHDCQGDGHVWRCGYEPCVACGMPWSEIYDTVIVRRPDGTLAGHVVPINEAPDPSLHLA